MLNLYLTCSSCGLEITVHTLIIYDSGVYFCCKKQHYRKQRCVKRIHITVKYGSVVGCVVIENKNLNVLKWNQNGNIFSEKLLSCSEQIIKNIIK